MPKSIISVKQLIRQKKGFANFLIDHYAGDIENISITGKYYHWFTMVNYYWFTQGDISIIPWFI